MTLNTINADILKGIPEAGGAIILNIAPTSSQEPIRGLNKEFMNRYGSKFSYTLKKALWNGVADNQTLGNIIPYRDKNTGGVAILLQVRENNDEINYEALRLTLKKVREWKNIYCPSPDMKIRIPYNMGNGLWYRMETIIAEELIFRGGGSRERFLEVEVYKR